MMAAPTPGPTSQVAEMTGRRGRVVRDARTGGSKFFFELRAKPDSSQMDSLNGARLQGAPLY